MSSIDETTKKLTENERRKLHRSQRTEEEIERDRQKDRERKAKKRSEQSASEKDTERQKNKERMADKRSQMTPYEKEIVKAKDRERKGDKTEAESNTIHQRDFRRHYDTKLRDPSSEFQVINSLLCMRELRKSRTDEKHMKDNMEAKKGMQLVREEGFSKSFSYRTFRDIDELQIWIGFYSRGTSYKDILKEKKPEVAYQVSEIVDSRRRKYAEVESKRKEERDKGFWEYDPINEDLYWTGVNPPGPDNPKPRDRDPEFDAHWGDIDDVMSPEEWDKLYSKWYSEMEADRKKEIKEERNRVAREKYQKQREELQKPIEVPEFELSEYEKIREQNIRDCKEALRAAGLLKD